MPANYTRNKCSRRTRYRCLPSRRNRVSQERKEKSNEKIFDRESKIRSFSSNFCVLTFAFLSRSVWQNYYPTQAMIYLNENNVMHRDIRGSNILLTKEGEIKLVDFGLSRTCQSEIGKRYTCVGSPSWMAPEVAMSKGNNSEGYGNRADVWAIGITAIELADGRPPFQDMHPTRALFQIIRNPPPTLYRPSNWSQNFNDFISEYVSLYNFQVISELELDRIYIPREYTFRSCLSDVSRRILKIDRSWGK